MINLLTLYKNNKIKRTLAIILTLSLFLSICPMVLPAAKAATAAELVAQINALGLTATYSGNNVTVNGNASATSPITLNIDPGATVNWGATFTGSLDRGRYVLTLSGGGTFNLTGLISNDAGGAINVTGLGAGVNINSGGIISSPPGGTGITLNVAANGVTVNVGSNGLIRNEGSNSAINVTAGINGATINISGGSVISEPSGYAINDGGTATCDNNTNINIVNNGTVRAGSACAIRSTGRDSTVSVINGTITNAASSNSNPTIYMNGGTGDNVMVGGSSVVQTTNTSSTSYVIQTTGNVLIQDDAQVIALAGRAINLVGMNSVARVTGGTVSAISGVAISTATTDPATVPNARVEISGGVVSTGSGTAIRTTGANSIVTVTGGLVTAMSGRAIDASRSATVNGGFVFAWGSNIGAVIRSTPAFTSATGNGVVIAWNTNTGTGSYIEGASNALVVSPPLASPDKVVWHDNGLTGGLHYSNGANAGFFPLNVDITIEPPGYGLVFDIPTGRFYLDTGITPIEDNTLYTGQLGAWEWEQSSSTLTLRGFVWTSEAPISLTVVGGNITLNLEKANSFVSTNNGANSTGIQSADNITITGSGTLNAAAGDAAINYGIDVQTLAIQGGTVTASGETSAIRASTVALPSGYTHITSTINRDGSGSATNSFPAGTGYSYSTSHKYVQIHTLSAHPLTVIRGTGSGSYFAGQDVTITASDLLPPGAITMSQPHYFYPHYRDVFISWASAAGGVFANTTSVTTTFIMPDNPVAVTAETQIAYKLFISGGTISAPGLINPQLGYFLRGGEVPLSAPSAPEPGWIFNGWQIVTGTTSIDNTFVYTPGGSFTDAGSRNTTFIMPAGYSIVEARPMAIVYPSVAYELIVIGGTGSGISITPGTGRPIIADPPPSYGLIFDRWEITVPAALPGYQGAFVGITDERTLFIMGEGNITITAMYRGIEHPLIVINGTAATSRELFGVGEQISIQANAPPTGQAFDRWEISGGGGSFANAGSPATTFTMPADSAIVTATYRDVSSSTQPNPPPSDHHDGDYGGWDYDTPTLVHDSNLPAPHTGPLTAEQLEIHRHIAFIQGIGDDLFDPDASINRAQVAQMFFNLLVEAGIEITASFPDVSVDAWYEIAVDVLATLGVLEGYPDGGFHPDDYITRAEFAAIAARFAKALNIPAARLHSLRFTDVPETHWAFSYIDDAADFGWIMGVCDGLFEPDRSITRAEAVAIVNRMLDRHPDREYIDNHDRLIRFTDVQQTHWAYYEILEAANTHDETTQEGEEHWEETNP